MASSVELVCATLAAACSAHDYPLIDACLAALREAGAPPADARLAARLSAAALARHASRLPCAGSMRRLSTALRAATRSPAYAFPAGAAFAAALRLDAMVRGCSPVHFCCRSCCLPARLHPPQLPRSASRSSCARCCCCLRSACAAKRRRPRPA